MRTGLEAVADLKLWQISAWLVERRADAAALAGDPDSSAIALAFSDSVGTQWLHVNPSEATNSLLPTDPAAARS